MWITLRRAVWMGAILTVATLTPTAQAQAPIFANIRLQSGAMIPDGGSIVLGALSWMSEGRNEFGPPILSHLPYAGRSYRNVGYGRQMGSVRVIGSVRIIDMEEEEFRQTGVRSR